MKRMILVAAAAALLSSAALAGDYEDAAIGIATARNSCPGFKIDSDRYDFFVAMAVTEMRLPLAAALPMLASQVTVYKRTMVINGTIDKFCAQMTALFGGTVL